MKIEIFMSIFLILCALAYVTFQKSEFAHNKTGIIPQDQLLESQNNKEGSD